MRRSILDVALSAALIILLLVGAFQYLQVNDLKTQNAQLSSEVARYNNLPANGSSLELMNSWLSHLAKLEALEPSTAIEDYTTNASMVIAGIPMPGIDGTYTGMSNVSESLSLLFGNSSNYPNLSPMALHASVMQIQIESYKGATLNGSDATIEANLSITGSSYLWGFYNGTIASNYHYVSQNGVWLISREDWNFSTFQVQYPVGPR